MHVSPLLSQLLKSKWFLNYETAISHFPDVDKMLSRDWEIPSAQIKRPALGVFVMSDSGKAIELNEESSFDSAPKGSTAIIPLKGTMLKYGTWCSYGTEEIAAEMIRAGKHPNINSIVLDIDTGGGAVDAVAPMDYAIDKVKNVFMKPVIASADLCASAGIWSASKCNKIVANNAISAHFGSIGVMWSYWDIAPAYEKAGYKQHVVNSNLSENKNEAFIHALEGNYDLIREEELNPLARKFQNTIKQNRGSKLDTSVPGILNGKMFYAEDALKYGLIDQIGSIETAVQIAQDISLSTNFNNTFKL